MKLYLGSSAVPPMGWTKVSTIDEALDLLLTKKISEVSVDYNIGDAYVNSGIVFLQKVEALVLNGDLTPPKMTTHCTHPALYDCMKEGLDRIENAVFYGYSKDGDFHQKSL